MGEQLAIVLKKHLEGESLEGHRGFGVIKANPEKSKHLETATIKILE